MNKTKICENTIEDMKFELYTNNNEKCYQTLNISTKGASTETNMIAPIDFFAIASAIMCSNNLDEFEDTISGTWCEDRLKKMVEDLFDKTNGLI